MSDKHARLGKKDLRQCLMTMVFFAAYIEMQNHQFMLKSLYVYMAKTEHKTFHYRIFLFKMAENFQKMKRWMTNIYTYVKLQMTVHLIITNQRSGSESRFTVEE